MYGCIILYSGGVLFSFFFIFGSRYGLQCQQDREQRAQGNRRRPCDRRECIPPTSATCGSVCVGAVARGPAAAGAGPRAAPPRSAHGPGPRPQSPPLRGARIRRSDQCVSYVWGAPDAGALLFFKISMCMKSTLTVTCQSLARASLLGCRRLQLGHLVRCPPLPLASDSAFIPRAAGLGADLLPIACDARASVDSA